MKKVVSTGGNSSSRRGYFLEKAPELQSSHRAVVAGPADRSLTPKSSIRAGTGRKKGQGESDQSSCYPAASDARSPLSVREIEVIRYLAQGFLYKEIADKMDITFSTVHKLQHKIFVKLHVGNRTEAINKWNGGIRT